MKTSLSISFSKIELNGSLIILDNLCRELQDTTYKDEVGYGFENIECIERYLTGSLIRRLPTFIPQFDSFSRQLVEREIFLYSKTKFAIDYDLQLLEVFGSAEQSPKLRTVLRNILSRKVAIQSFGISLTSVIQHLNDTNSKYVIDNLTVDNFRHRDGVIGRYAMRISLPELAGAIINEYSNDVRRAHLQIIDSPVGDFEINLSRTGTVKIRCEDATVATVFSYLKSLIVVNTEG